MTLQPISARDERKHEIYLLMSDLREVENEIAMFEQQKENIRNRLSQLVLDEGGTFELPGVAKFEITSPTIAVSYDKDGINAIVQELVKQDQPELAQQILACQKQSMRAGTLRITKERKKA